MGYDADCTLTINGAAHRGIARLEHKDLTFRGDWRLIIPLSEIVEVRADGRDLFLRFGDRTVVLTIGAAAATWARRIANPPSRLDKLGVKAGMRVALLEVPDDSFEDEIESRGALIAGSKAKDLDLVFVGVRSPIDLNRLGALVPRLRPQGAVWVIRAKGKGATISESESMAAGKRAGLVDVKVVSFSDTHSAEKYVIPVAKRAGSLRSSSPRARRPGSAPSRGRT